MATRLEMLERLVAQGPKDAFPYYCLAQEYRSAGRADDALATFQTLRDRFPEYVPQYLMAAQACESSGRREEARAWLTAGIDAARRAGDAHARDELDAMLSSLEP